MTGSRTSRFVTSALLSYIYQGSVMVAGLLLAPFLLRRLGQHDYGLWIVGFQVLSYLMLLDLGVVALLPREVAYITGKPGGIDSNGSELALLVGQTARVVLYQTPFVVVGSAVLWFMKPEAWRPYYGVISLVLIIFVCAFPLRILAAILQGLQDVTYWGVLNLVTWAVGQAITVALVLKNFGLYALAVSWAATQVITIVASAYRLRRRFPEVLPSGLPSMSFSALRQFLAKGCWVSLNQIAGPLLSGSDFVIVGKLMGAAAVVPYSSTNKLFGVLSNQPQMLMEKAVPGLSELRTNSSSEHVYKVMIALALFILLLSGGIASVVIGVNQGFVTRWLGKEQFGGLLLTTLLALTMLLRQWNLSAAYTTYCFGHERRIVITAFIDGLVTTAATFAFVWTLGPIGGPLGQITGVVFVGLPSNLGALAREAKISLVDFLKPLGGWLWRCVVFCLAAIASAYIAPPMTIVEIVIRGGVIGLLYCACMWPVAMRSPLGVYLLRIRIAAQARVPAFARLMSI